MIFQYTWEQVLAGEKVSTRRPVKKGQRAVTQNDRITSVVASLTNGERTVYALGGIYAVQPGRTKKAVGRIGVTGLRREDVRQISERDARAEGFKSRRDFLRLWTQMYDKPAVSLMEDAAWETAMKARPARLYDAWVLEFERVAPEE